MNAAVVLKNVKKIEIKTRKLVDGLMSGAYHSLFKGRGIEFSEVREYTYGDDVRSIDWNVTARMNHPFVKEFIEERDLTVYLVFDVSKSGSFGGAKEKKDIGIELAASIMFSALRSNDNVGLALFTDRLEKLVSPRKGKRHILKLIRDLLYYEPKSNKTDLDKSLSYLAKAIKRRSIIFIISDFYSPDFSKPLKLLREKNDIIAIKLRDPIEENLPDLGYIELEDSETGEQLLIDTGDPDFRKRYSALLLDSDRKLVKTLAGLGIDVIKVYTNEPFEIPLRRFFRKRLR